MGKALPAWSLSGDAVDGLSLDVEWPEQPSRAWATEGSTGAGISVCILDSGIDAAHPRVTPIASAVAVALEDGVPTIVPDESGDVCGHGTACAGLVRSIAPDCEIHSVRILGAGATGGGDVLLAGLRHAVDSGYRVVNLSLSTTKKHLAEVLHEIADAAYFRRTVLVASAHNMPVESYPWRFSSVISVGSHEGDDPLTWYANPAPPVEFFARGVDVEVAWPGGGTMRCTGNSFAAPHLAGVCALVLAKHPGMTPFELKSLLYLTAANARGGR
ncbi:MAG TPA: S8 family serine peptidase [Gaiellaceae bacterium]|jgi:subtilisin family serine protease